MWTAYYMANATICVFFLKSKASRAVLLVSGPPCGLVNGLGMWASGDGAVPYAPSLFVPHTYMTRSRATRRSIPDDTPPQVLCRWEFQEEDDVLIVIRNNPIPADSG